MVELCWGREVSMGKSDCTSAFQSKRLRVTIFYILFKEMVAGEPLPGPIIISSELACTSTNRLTLKMQRRNHHQLPLTCLGHSPPPIQPPSTKALDGQIITFWS